MGKKENSESKKKLQNDLETYLEFVALYKKTRPPEAKRLIEQIINEENSIIVRIKRIEEIDEKYNKTSEALEVEDKTQVKEPPKKIEVPFTLEKCSFFKYFIFERAKLVQFGTRTQTIDFSLFGIKKELSAKAIVFWRQVYSELRDNMFKPIAFILLNGWKDLDQKSYNLVVTFNKFMLKFIREGELLNRNNPPLQNLKVVESFIEPYLKLTLDPSYKDQLREAVLEILSPKQDFKGNLKEIMRTLDELINTDKRNLCFFNIILAIYSLNYNHFIKHFDLVRGYKVTEIPMDQHEFDQKTYNEIKEYMVKVNEELAEVEGELFFLKYVDDLLDIKSPPENKVVTLFNQYSLFEQLSKKEMSNPETSQLINSENPYQNLNSALVKTLSKAIEGFLAYYTGILKGNIDVFADGKTKTVSIFDENLFRKEIHDLEVITKDYNYYRRKGPEAISITYNIYLSYVQMKRVEIEKEEKLCLMALGIVNNLKEIAYKTIKALYFHEKALQCTGELLLEKYKSQNQTIVDFFGESRFIPYAFEKVKVHRYLEGDRVIDILNDIAYFSLSIAYFFKQSDIMSRYVERDSYLDKMEKILKIKAKVE